MNNLTKNILIGSAAALGTVIITGFAVGQIVKTKKFYVEIDGVEEDVNITVISDLHDSKFDFSRKRILKKVRQVKPDVILLPGDINTSKNVYEYFGLLYELKQIAPVYYVKGNHDDDYGNYEKFIHELGVLGIEVLNDDSCEITIKNNTFNLIGIQDPSKKCSLVNTSAVEQYMDEKQDVFLKHYNPSINNIVMSHRPNYLIDLLAYENVIGFAGHTHGGIIKCGRRGLIVPDQGIFAKYAYGAFRGNNSLMFITSGIGKPFMHKFYNPNEILSITIHGNK